MDSVRSRVFNILEINPKTSLKKCWRLFKAYPKNTVKGAYYDWRRINTTNKFHNQMIEGLYFIMKEDMTPKNKLTKKKKELIKAVQSFISLLKEGAPSI